MNFSANICYQILQFLLDYSFCLVFTFPHLQKIYTYEPGIVDFAVLNQKLASNVLYPYFDVICILDCSHNPQSELLDLGPDHLLLSIGQAFWDLADEGSIKVRWESYRL